MDLNYILSTFFASFLFLQSTSFKSPNRLLPRLPILLINKRLKISRDLSEPIILPRHRRTKLRPARNNTSPNPPHKRTIPAIHPIIRRPTGANLGAGGLDVDPDDAGRRELAAGGRHAAVVPALGHQVVGDEGEGVQALCVVGDGGGEAVDGGGGVVAAVVEGGEREYDSLHRGCGDGDWDLGAGLCAGGFE
jgi:hypothetical protein